MQDSRVYVTLHGVKIPRLLFPCQVSVAVQEGLLSICLWGGVYIIDTQNPTPLETITFKEPDSKI